MVFIPTAAGAAGAAGAPWEFYCKIGLKGQKAKVTATLIRRTTSTYTNTSVCVAKHDVKRFNECIKRVTEREHKQ